MRQPARSGWSRSTRRSRRRSPARSSSGTSPRSCTRATRRWPSGGPRPCRSTARVLAELLGREELRELIDQAALADLELELQLLTAERKVRDADGLHDALRLLGDLTVEEAAARSTDPAAAAGWLDELEAVAAGDPAAGRRPGALDRHRGRGPAPRRARGGPAGRGAAGASSSRSPTRSATWSARYARTHGPFLAAGRGRAGSAWAWPWSSAGPGPAGGGRPGRRGRVPPGRFGPRVDRRRGAAAAAAALAGRVPPRGRARPAGGARPVRWARGRGSARPGPRAADLDALYPGGRAAPGRADARLGSRAPGPGRPPARLPPAACSTSSAPPARSCGPGPVRSAPTTAGSCLCAGRRRPAAAPRAACRSSSRRWPQQRPRRPGRRRGDVLPPARGRGRLHRRHRAAAALSGSWSGPATSPTTPWPRCEPWSPAAARTTRRRVPARRYGRRGPADAHPPRPARRRRPLEPGPDRRRRGGRPDPAAARGGRAAAGPARRR